MTDYLEIINDLFDWKYEELAKGNRTKASIIQKIETRIELRRKLYYEIIEKKYINI